MAQLLVRNLSEALVKKLKRRAVEHGVSAEEEHRRILNEALNAEPKKEKAAYTIKDHLLSLEHTVDEIPLPPWVIEKPREIEF